MDNNIKKLSIEDRIRVVEETFTKALSDNNLKYTITIDFPIYKELPDEVKLSLLIIEKHKCKIGLAYLEDKEQKNEN